MIDKKSPCQHCDRRQAGCHSHCQAYIEFKEFREMQAELVSKYKKEHCTCGAYNCAKCFSHTSKVLQQSCTKRG